MEKEKMIEIILKEERFLWKAYKKAVEENGGQDGSTAAYRFKCQHDEIMNLMDELEIERK